MKLQLSLIMIAALALGDDVVQVPSVWNNWNNDPENMPAIDGNTGDPNPYLANKEYFAKNPLNQPIDHSYSHSPLAGYCHAIQGPPIPAPNNQEQRPRFCRFGGYTTDWNRCCHGIQDG